MRSLFSIIAVLLFCCNVVGEEQVLQIRNFKGLNTRSGDFAIQPNEFRVLHNSDLSDLGAFKKRKGYSPYITFTGVDSLVGVYNAVYSDGSSELLVLTDPDTLGYGHLMKWNPVGSFTRVDTLWIIRDTSAAVENIWFRGNYGATGFSIVINGADTTTTMSFLVDAISDSITSYMTGLTVTSADSTTYGGASPDSGFIVISYDTTGAQQSFILTNFYYPYNLWNSRTVTINTPVTISTTIFPHYSVQSQPTFSMYDNDVYISNGHQKMVIWTGERAKEVPTPAPSDPRIVPIVSSTGSRLDGMYRYLIQALVFDTTANNDTYHASYLSPPIRVDSGHVLLTGFHTPAKRFANGIDTVATIDSLELHIYRLKTTRTKFNEVDTAIGIKVLSFSANGSFYDTTFIDSMPFDSFVAPTKLPLLDPVPAERTSGGTLRLRYGAPTFLYNTVWTNADTVTGETNSDSVGVYWSHNGEGGPEYIMKHHVGFAYTCTFYDTLTGAESDTGRALWIYQSTGDTSKSYGIGLPALPDSLLDCKINLYRTPLRQAGHDVPTSEGYTDTVRVTNEDSLRTSCRFLLQKDGIFPGMYRFEVELAKCMSDHAYAIIDNRKRVIRFQVDSVYASNSEWRLVNSYDRTVEYVEDDLRSDSIISSLHPRYSPHQAPPLLEGVVSLSDNLWGFAGSRIYLSDDEIGTMWNLDNNIAINLNDGDTVTMMSPTRGVMEIFKQNSKVNVFETVFSDGSTNWNRTEISGFFGSIAGKSRAASLQGTYYLSNDGVIIETEGQFRDRSVATNLLSRELDNFDKLTNAQKFSAVGFAYDHKYMLSVPAVGTTYVYDEIAKSWSTWDGMVFQDATLRGDTMLFINDNNVYSYGTSEYDNGNTINMTFTTPPLFPDAANESITRIALWIRNGDTISTIPIVLYDEQSDSIAASTFDSLFKRVTLRGFSSNESALPYFKGGNPTFNISTAIIDGFDIYYTKHGMVKEE